jgi:enoyl-CoA hydratase/carnithine racemase
MMKTQRDADAPKGFFLVETSEDVAVLRSNVNAFSVAADLKYKEALLAFFNDLSHLDSVKVLVIMSSQDNTGGEEYFEFARRLKNYDWEREVFFKRFVNTIDQLILEIVRLDKIVIHANSGNVISLLFNLSLACDYRIVADNTTFHNLYLDVGLLPMGGGAFFLSRRLGQSKSYEVLLNHKEISAVEAMRLGIVDKVVPQNRLEEFTLKVAHRFAEKPAHSLAGMKRLLNYSLFGLKEYLEFENGELLRTIHSKEFLNRDLRSRESHPQDTGTMAN